MKLIAALIITCSLVLGMIASTTAYVPQLDAIDPATELTLNAPAGRSPETPGAPRVTPDDAEGDVLLDASLLEQLDDDGEERVRVKEFAWSRWSHRWYFVLSCVGLVAGAVLIRHAQRQQVGQPGVQQRQHAIDPVALLDDVVARIDRLLSEVGQTSDAQQRAAMIIAQLDELHDVCLEPFVNARAQLVARYGMAGYAQIMDLFAGAERITNRAWSAAADGVLVEAQVCLETARERYEDARLRVKSLSDGSTG